MTDTFHVKNPGLLTTVQDLGRPEYGQYGIPVSGAMDRFSLQTANRLVGNGPGAAGLEITLFMLELKILKTVRAAITGGDMNPLLDGSRLPMWQTVELPAGSTLHFKEIRRGVRAYLAVEGGFDSPVFLGSRSTNQSALLGKSLQAGDVLCTLPGEKKAQFYRLPETLVPDFSDEPEIRVLMGPQDDFFTQRGIKTFLGEAYTVTSQSNRQGYRLEGPPIEHASGADIISDAILPGAVQVPGNGQPIIMMVDAQTTGGYTKIACVIGPDIDRLAQIMPGQRLRFSRVSIQEAHRAVRAYADKLENLEKEMIPWDY
jgi:biotin-dependent carboxylase-like uncharacterized protein